MKESPIPRAETSIHLIWSAGCCTNPFFIAGKLAPMVREIGAFGKTSEDWPIMAMKTPTTGWRSGRKFKSCNRKGN